MRTNGVTEDSGAALWVEADGMGTSVAYVRASGVQRQDNVSGKSNCCIRSRVNIRPSVSREGHWYFRP